MRSGLFFLGGVLNSCDGWTGSTSCWEKRGEWRKSTTVEVFSSRFQSCLCRPWLAISPTQGRTMSVYDTPPTTHEHYGRYCI